MKVVLDTCVLKLATLPNPVNPAALIVELCLAVPVEYLLTVNTANGHFDRPDYQGVLVLSPGRFLHLPEVQGLVQRQFPAQRSGFASIRDVILFPQLKPK